jgi:hypothetical protein
MQLRTQLKRNLLQSSSNHAPAKGGGASDFAHPAQPRNEAAHVISPSRSRKEPMLSGQHQYVNDY